MLVRPSIDNAARLLSALREFGFGRVGLSAEDFTAEGKVIQLGVAPNRIESNRILTSLTGCEFEDVWTHRISAEIGDIPVSMIDREQYICDKRAVGRPQDLADLAALS